MLNVVVERVQRKREARVPIRRMQFKITSVNPVLHVEVRYTELMSREFVMEGVIQRMSLLESSALIPLQCVP